MLLKIMNRIRGTTYYTDGYDLYNVNGNIVFFLANAHIGRL